MPAVRLGKVVLLPRLALPLSLPGKMPVFPRSLPPFPPTLLPLLPSLEDRGPPNPSNTQAGQTNNPTNNLRQGSGQPPRQRPPQASQEVHATSWEGNNSTAPLLGIPRVLLKKNLTLSGSLTFPTNPWHQLKGLFWLKGPTLRLPLGSLPT